VLEFFFFFLSGDALWSETRISDTRLRFRVAWPSSRIRALLSFFVLSATQLKNSALRDVDYISFMATFHILWGEALLFFFSFLTLHFIASLDSDVQFVFYSGQ
jgi:hypothetical protein